MIYSLGIRIFSNKSAPRTIGQFVEKVCNLLHLQSYNSRTAAERLWPMEKIMRCEHRSNQTEMHNDPRGSMVVALPGCNASRNIVENGLCCYYYSMRTKESFITCARTEWEKATWNGMDWWDWIMCLVHTRCHTFISMQRNEHNNRNRKKKHNKLVDLPIFLHHGCFASRRRLPAVRAMSRCSMCFICIPFFKSLLHTMYKWAVRSLRCDCYRNRIDAEIYKTDRQTKYHNLSRSNFRLFNQQHNFKRKQYM